MGIHDIWLLPLVVLRVGYYFHVLILIIFQLLVEQKGGDFLFLLINDGFGIEMFLIATVLTIALRGDGGYRIEYCETRLVFNLGCVMTNIPATLCN